MTMLLRHLWFYDVSFTTGTVLSFPGPSNSITGGESREVGHLSIRPRRHSPGKKPEA
jgi:hypothetical protein